MKIEVEQQDVRVSEDFKTSSYAIGDVAFIVDMLADKVYTDKEAAVIRELSCNAYDSHVMAGKKDVPFDVHIPTVLEPFFSVRDYGTGLSDEDVRGIFAGIGISTKRNNNEVIGCFGIGSLSPYALVNSFTVKSWHNGVVNTYSCYRDANREPVVALLHSEDSGDPNGVEVSFPIEASWRNDFQRAAVKTFQHWDILPNINSQSVLNDCQSIKDSVILQGDGYKVVSSYENYAVMGNVAYSIPHEMLRFKHGLVLYFDMGEVSFDAARENLSMDEKTSKAVDEKYQAFENDAKANISGKIEAAVGKFNKWTTWKKFSNCGLLQNICISIMRYSTTVIDVQKLKGKKFRSYTKRSGGRVSRKELESFAKNWESENFEIFVKVGDKDSAESRIKNYLNSGSCPVIGALLVDQDLVDDYEIPLELCKPVTSLPKPQYSRNRASGRKQKYYKFSYWGGTTQSHWDEIEIDLSSETALYVPVKNLNPVIPATMLNARIKLLKDRGVNVPPVIGLNSSVTKTKKFSKAGHILFNDYYREEIAKIANSGDVYTCFNVEFFNCCNSLCSLNMYIKQDNLRNLCDGKMRRKLSDSLNNNLVIQTCKELGIAVVPPEDQEEFVSDVKSFFDSYPMLRLAMNDGMIETDTVRTNLDMIAEYIGGTKK